MAPKNQALARQPSKEEQEREESSDEEENSESDSGETEEEGSSSEEEAETPVSTKPQALVPKSESKLNLKSKSTLVNGSDSDAETEGSPPPDYKVEPIRKPSPAKRGREEGQDLSKSSKKLKTEEKKIPNSTPGGLIARLWSDEDEIAVLNGMIEFRKVKGNDNNGEEIYNFIKGKLQGEFNRVQLRTKIARMKKRFMNALKKGSDPVFSKPHEEMAFELSKKIWGDAVNGNGNNVKKEAIKNGNGNGNVKKEIVKAEVEEKDEAEERDFWSKYPYLSSSFLNMKGISEASVNLLKENMSSIGDSKAKELNQKWRQLFLEEAEVNHKMLILIAEQTKLGLNQINDS